MIRARVLFLFTVLSAITALTTATARAENEEGGRRLISGKVKAFTGPEGHSMNGLYGYGLDFSTLSRPGSFHWLTGVGFSYTQGNVRLPQRRGATMIGGEFSLGVGFSPFAGDWIAPFLDAGGLVGANYLQLSAVSGSTASRTLSYTYGYFGTMGVDIRAGEFSFIRLFAQYFSKRAPKLANDSSFVLEGIAFGLGLSF